MASDSDLAAKPASVEDGVGSDNVGHPFCFWCGYDLRGLELPRACPECGRVCDRVRDEREAREWFAQTRSCLGGLLRPSTVPAGVCYSLNDAGSIKVAKRRCFRWIWLPLLLTCVVVAIGALVRVEWEVRISYHDSSDASRPPLRMVERLETDQPYGLNLHLFRGGLLFQKPVSWVKVVEKTRRRVFISTRAIDTFAAMFVVLPSCVVFFGYLPGRFLLIRRARRMGVNRGIPELRESMGAVWAVPAPVLGMAVWLWFLCVVSVGAHTLYPWSHDMGGVWSYPVVVSAGLWIAYSLLSWRALVRMDRAGKVFNNRPWAGLGLVAATLGGPVIAVAVLAFLLG